MGRYNTSRSLLTQDAIDWCDEFATQGQSVQGSLSASMPWTGLPCVCPFDGYGAWAVTSSTCNQQLNPPAYFEPLGQPRWCENWERGKQFSFVNNAPMKTVVESDADYRSRKIPCECLSPISTAIPEMRILGRVMLTLLAVVEPIALFLWLRYQRHYCKLGVCGQAGDGHECAAHAKHVQQQLLRRRFSIVRAAFVLPTL
jgi:hypothetical protein